MDKNLQITLGWVLLHFLWQGALVALGLFIGLSATKKRSPRVRYGMGCVALLMLAICPIVTYAIMKPATDTFESTVVTHQGATMILKEVSSSSTLIAPQSGVIAEHLPAFVAVWALGVIVLTVRLAGGLLQVERLKRRHAMPANVQWQSRIQELAHEMGIRRRVSLLISDRIEVPSTMGIFRSFVIVPASLLLQMVPDQAEAILMHELAHIRRHDYLINLLQTTLETLLFYHPAVWWISHIVRQEREHCCDELVLNAPTDPIVFARALTSLETLRRTAPTPSLSAKGGNLMKRIQQIVSPRPAPVRMAPIWSFAATLAIVTAIGGSSTIRAHAQSTPAAESPKVPIPVINDMLHSDDWSLMSPLTADDDWTLQETATVNTQGAAPAAPAAKVAPVSPVAPTAPASPLAPKDTIAIVQTTAPVPAKPPVSQEEIAVIVKDALAKAKPAMELAKVQMLQLKKDPKTRKEMQKAMADAHKEMMKARIELDRAFKDGKFEKEMREGLAQARKEIAAERLKLQKESDPKARAEAEAGLAAAEAAIAGQNTEVIVRSKEAAKLGLEAAEQALKTYTITTDTVDISRPAYSIANVPTINFTSRRQSVEIHNSGKNKLGMVIKGADFNAVVEQIGKVTGASFVIAPGAYTSVTLTLHDQPISEVFKALAFAAGANLKVSNGVYYFSSTSKNFNISPRFGYSQPQTAHFQLIHPAPSALRITKPMKSWTQTLRIEPGTKMQVVNGTTIMTKQGDGTTTTTVTKTKP